MSVFDDEHSLCDKRQGETQIHPVQGRPPKPHHRHSSRMNRVTIRSSVPYTIARRIHRILKQNRDQVKPMVSLEVIHNAAHPHYPTWYDASPTAVNQLMSAYEAADVVDIQLPTIYAGEHQNEVQKRAYKLKDVMVDILYQECAPVITASFYCHSCFEPLTPPCCFVCHVCYVERIMYIRTWCDFNLPWQSTVNVEIPQPHPQVWQTEPAP